ncbi:hypothetical protein GALMADRAFT_270766 [Galerina marginata CBS 339.88]|uniref:Uncharacterized protein n=1 Tax=Galerina marginata (strain CBS 339.88) TaxID=685588 RepID=A0A067SX93_GALM3|nr:hypothetical protein GALMADRAFT_270766 [Galerina marginata CBS 339.88]
MYSRTPSSHPTPQVKMSTHAQRADKIRSTFARFLFLYTSPALTFFTVRWFVSAIIGIWSWMPTIRSTSAESLSISLSAAPYVLGSLCAVGVIMFGPLPGFLALDLAVSLDGRDPVFVLFSVVQIHMFLAVMVIKIYAPPIYTFLPAAIITYPITHAFMDQQFVAVGALPAQLGYFAATSGVFKSWMTSTHVKIKALFLSEERDTTVTGARKSGQESSKDLKQMDGKSSDGL